MVDKAPERFIPSQETVLKAASELPPVDSVRGEAHEVEIGKKRTITFRRIKMKDADGRGYRWVYDGKMVVK